MCGYGGADAGSAVPAVVYPGCAVAGYLGGRYTGYYPPSMPEAGLTLISWNMTDYWFIRPFDWNISNNEVNLGY